MAEERQVDTRAGYDRWSRFYDDDPNPLVFIEEPVVRRLAGEVRGLGVADLGCGTGRHSAWLVEAGARVDGFDASAGMAERARAKLGDRARVREHRFPDPIPAEPGAYDLTLFALVADHVADLDAAFREIRRVTRPGGRAIFTVLHPAMNLRGVTARFSDPETGAEVRPEAFEHPYSAYVMAVLRAGFAVETIEEHAADEALAARTPRAERYIGWPMLLAMLLRA